MRNISKKDALLCLIRDLNFHTLHCIRPSFQQGKGRGKPGRVRPFHLYLAHSGRRKNQHLPQEEDPPRDKNVPFPSDTKLIKERGTVVSTGVVGFLSYGNSFRNLPSYEGFRGMDNTLG